MKNIFFVLLIVLSSQSYAAYIHGVNSKVVQVSTYGRGVVAGDIKIVLENHPTGCEAGYYLKKDNPGKDSALSIALSAFHSGKEVKIYAYASPRWEGSSGNVCEIEGIHIVE